MTDNITCTVIQGDQTYVSDLPGLRPLMNWLHQSPEIFEGSYVIDKVVGKASAGMMAFGGVVKVYAETLSRLAIPMLEAGGIEYSYGTLVDQIIIPEGDNRCPLEKIVFSAKTPGEVVSSLREHFAQMRSAHS